MTPRRAIELELEDPAAGGPVARLERELGRALAAEGLLSEAELAEARERQATLGGRLSTCLYELGLVDELRLRSACGRILRVPTALPSDVASASRALLDLVDRAAAARDRAIPYARSGGTLLVATAEPWRLPLLETIGSRAGGRAEARFLDEGPIARLLGDLYGAPVDERFRAAPAPRRRTTAPRLQVGAAERPAPRELMSETAFEHLYQSGERPAPPPEAIATLADARSALAAARDPREIAGVLVRFALGRAKRALLLVRGPEVWMGVAGGGAGVDPRIAQALMVPAAPGTIFRLVEDVGTPFSGLLPRHAVHDRLIALLGGGAPRAAALLPARSAQLALALYCDGGPGGELGDLRELQILVAEAPGAFQRLSAPSARR